MTATLAPPRASLLSAPRRFRLPQGAALYLAVTLAVVAAALLHWRAYGPPLFGMDDAYITMHNAQVLHWGRDPNYLGTPALAGATSPIHLALVAAAVWVLPPPWATYLVAWLAALAYGWGLVRLSLANRASWWQAALLTGLGLLVGRTPHQLLNGLETGLMLAAVTWGLALLSARESCHHRALAALCGVMPFLRPELALLSLLFAGLSASFRLRAAGSLRAAWRPLLGNLAAALLCAAPWALWCLRATGQPFPLTAATKACYVAQAGWPPAEKLGLLWEGFAGFASELQVLGWCGLLLVCTRLGWTGLVFGATLAVAYYLEFPRAVATYEHRYLFPLLPFVLYGAVSAFARRERHLQLAVSALLLVAACQVTFAAPRLWRDHLTITSYARDHLVTLAAWCSKELPPESHLLVHDAGYIAYGTRFRLTDLVGLKTPGSVAYHRALTYPSNGARRAEAVAAIALASRATHVVVQDSWDRRYQLTEGFRRQGWSLRALNTGNAFTVYSLHPPPLVRPRGPVQVTLTDGAPFAPSRTTGTP